MAARGLSGGAQRPPRAWGGEPGHAFVPCAGIALEELLCVHEDREVGRDNCVSWQGRRWQIPEQRHRRHYVKATIEMRKYPDGRIAIFDGPRCLARYLADGALIDDTVAHAA